MILFLLDLKKFMTNLLNRTTCTVQGVQQSCSHQKLLTIQKRVSTLCILASCCERRDYLSKKLSSYRVEDSR